MASDSQQANTSTPMVTIDSLEQLAERVDKAIAEVQTLEPDVRAKALSLKSAIEEFHKAGLTHIVRTLKGDPNGKQLLFDLVDEPTVYALLSMHGLIRADVRTRVARVIEMVRPYMQSHGGDVQLVDVRDQSVFVRLSGNCNGCSMSSVTLRNTVEEALREHVPEIEAVEVVPNEPEGAGLVQLGGAAAPAPTDGDHGWLEGPTLEDVGAASLFAFECDKHNVLLVKTEQGYRAYRNACAHQGLPLDGGMLDDATGTLTCPWHGFQFDAESGECFSAPQCQLEPFPLRVIDDRIWIRPE